MVLERRLAESLHHPLWKPASLSFVLLWVWTLLKRSGVGNFPLISAICVDINKKQVASHGLNTTKRFENIISPFFLSFVGCVSAIKYKLSFNQTHGARWPKTHSLQSTYAGPGSEPGGEWQWLGWGRKPLHAWLRTYFRRKTLAKRATSPERVWTCAVLNRRRRAWAVDQWTEWRMGTTGRRRNLASEAKQTLLGVNQLCTQSRTLSKMRAGSHYQQIKNCIHHARFAKNHLWIKW